MQAMDFVNYTLRVAEGEGPKEHDDVGNIKIAEFLSISQRVREINNEYELIAILR
jgi:hypothetical protein